MLMAQAALQHVFSHAMGKKSVIYKQMGFPGGSAGKESACNAGDLALIRVGEIPWRRVWQPTPVFLPGVPPWTEEPDGLQSMGFQRPRHDWVTKQACTNKHKCIIFISICSPSLRWYPSEVVLAFLKGENLLNNYIFFIPSVPNKAKGNESA